MEFGARIFMSELTIDPARLAREVQARGLTSLHFGEHTHIPASRTTPYPPGGPLPEDQKHSFDPFVALTVAALAAPEIQVGTSVCLVAQRDPVLLAKQVASLDVISGGRVRLGVGFGWNREEAADHGVAWDDRIATVVEKVQVLKALWTQPIAEHVGAHVSLTPSWQYPKPVRSPHPPVLFGTGPAGFDALVAVGDGWMPSDRIDVARQLRVLRDKWEAAGRDGRELIVDVCLTQMDAAAIEGFQALGVDRCIALLPVAPPAAVLERLDTFATIARQVAA